MNDVCFSYPNSEIPALENVNLSLRRGDFMLVVGPIGSGKTTLLRCMKGIASPKGTLAGTVVFDGCPMDEMPTREQALRISYVSQDAASQVVTDQVLSELAFGLEQTGCPQDEMRVRIADVASMLGIADWMDRPTADLSGGELQMLNLASALVLHPDLLLLDEPTRELDDPSSQRLLDAIWGLNRQSAMTVVLTEHAPEEAWSLASDAALMESGTMRYAGTPEEVASFICKERPDLLGVLPVPARIWFESGAYALEDGSGDSKAFPLDVRQGRIWLRSLMDSSNAHQRHDPDADDAPANKQSLQAAPSIRPRAAYSVAPMAIAMEDACFGYSAHGELVLDGLSLHVPEGAVYMVVGANGCGKSTLLKAASGLLPLQRGSLRIFDHKVRQRKGWLADKRVALLPQDAKLLFCHETVSEELYEMVSHLGEAEQDAKIRRACETFCLQDLMTRCLAELSRGQSQLVSLAKVALTGASILLLDEPLSNLDSKAKHAVSSYMHAFAESGGTILASTHDLDFCAEHADACAFMFDGSIASCESPMSLIPKCSFFTTAAHRITSGLLDGISCASDAIREIELLS